MIRKDKLNRIMNHLDSYGNTIIVPNDFKHSALDNLIECLKDKGYPVEIKSYRPQKDSICEHWTIQLERGKDAK